MAQSIVISNISIGQDEHGRYCLNHLHKAAGGYKRHQPANWLRMDTAKELISELKREQNSEMRNAENSSPAETRTLNEGGYSKTRRPLLENEEAPVINVNDGKNNGTYAVKELVYAYAMWISPKFHLHVIRAFDGQQAPALPSDTDTLALYRHMNELHQQLGERNDQIISMLQGQNQTLSSQVVKLTGQVERLCGKVISTQGQLIRTQKHVTTLVEGRMDGAQASEAIVQMHQDGHSNAQIVAATGRNHNHVRQKLWQARRDGVLPSMDTPVTAQTGLFAEAA